jgi:hypothetical protein
MLILYGFVRVDAPVYAFHDCRGYFSKLLAGALPAFA